MSFVLAGEIYSQTITQQGVRIQWLKVVEAVVISGKSSGQNLPFNAHAQPEARTPSSRGVIPGA
jgi:hypothetical protein